MYHHPDASGLRHACCLAVGRIFQPYGHIIYYWPWSRPYNLMHASIPMDITQVHANYAIDAEGA